MANPVSGPALSPPPPRFQSVSTRNWILASFWLIAILATPVWWTTTTIERRALPRGLVKQWSARSPCPISIPIRVNLDVSDSLVPDSFPYHDAALSQLSLNAETHDSLEAWLESVRSDVSTRLDVASRGAWEMPLPAPPPAEGEESSAAPITGRDESPHLGQYAACVAWNVVVSAQGESSSQAANPSTPFLAYDVTLTSDSAPISASTSSKPRSFSLSVSDTRQRSLALSSQVSSSLADLFQLPYPDLAAMQLAPPPGRKMLGLAHSIATDLRPIPFAQRVRLVFSLLNEDVSARRSRADISAAQAAGEGQALFGGVKGWTSQGLDAGLVDQLGRLVEDLKEVYDIGVESQAQWSAPLAFEPQRFLVADVDGGVLEGDKGEQVAEVMQPVESEVREGPVEETQPAESRPVEDGETNEEGEVFHDAGEAPESTTDSTDAAEAQEVEASLAPVDPIVEPALISTAEATQSEAALAVPELEAKKGRTQYLIDTESLKSFINPADWSLASPSGPQTFPPSPFGGRASGLVGNATTRREYEEVASERILHFILYVPSTRHQPLRIQETSGDSTIVSASKAWLLPQWGGVYLFNPSEELAGLAPQREGELAPDLGKEQLQAPLRTFRKQLSTLLGLHAIDASYRGRIPSLAARTLALDNMARRRLLESSRESVESMASIVRLVDKIGNLAVGRSVQADVGRALELLEELEQVLSGSSNLTDVSSSSSLVPSTLSHALHLSGTAASLSSRAFFDPDMLGQLYFPEEHKYAVYTPLFGPVSVPLLVALGRAWKEWRASRRRRREDKEKVKDVDAEKTEKKKSK